ncbi:mucin-19 isoform X2 [Rhagoletis pomonella]|uniref:mucin-19 isoform X2 n=1 Tax=Rhagoletis pomonella TaxID=28610 RepID=UPI0017803D87|nr:mucin-19 isoform X2 [Rhagoletis pomonella]
MIGSFWNLCRACPSMPVDKLHSEYRSTYRWHEFTGNSRPEVVRRAPAPNPSQFIASLTGPTNEPPLPRRKKCPELAYKSHEFIIGSEYTDARGGHANRLARSEERGGTPSRRSKSEGPPVVPNGRAYAIPEEVDGTAKKQAGESNGLFKKTISKLSTEYRLQFVWPNVRRQKGIEAGDAADHPRKSISMGALKASQQQQQQQQQLHLRQHPQAAMPTVHKKRTTNQKEATLHELEPLVSDAEESKPHEKQVTIVEKVERKTTIRPFSQAFDQERANHFITKKENFGFEEVKGKGDGVDNKQQEQEVLLNGTAPPRSQPNLDLWFKEVVELRKKAGEYKCRGWGREIDPELYKKQKDLWEQVSKRSSLSALSLASSVHRPITKEEKEQENNKKSIPISKATQKSRVPGHAHMIDNKDEISALPARFSNIRHHLERTTGPDVEEGALLPSPTREKLMPAITKRESESQRGSPKKTAASRHGSPQKGSPQKGSPKKVIKTRSQSVGPAEHVSPKRQLRSASTAPSARLTAGKKTPTVPHHATSAATAGSGTVERKARPSTLSTTFHSRTKSSSLPPPSGRAQSVSATAATTTTTTTTTASKQQQSNRLHQSTKAAYEPQAFQKSGQLCKNYTQTAYGMPLLRKKDKDKTNMISVVGGKAAGESRMVKPRPKSTGAALNVTTTSAVKPARPVSATETILTAPNAAVTAKLTAQQIATDVKKTPVTNAKKENDVKVEDTKQAAAATTTAAVAAAAQTVTAQAKDKATPAEIVPSIKPKVTEELPFKSVDPMMASIFGGQIAGDKDGSGARSADLMTASIFGQLPGGKAADPMMTSVFGQLPSSGRDDNATLAHGRNVGAIAGGGSGSSGGNVGGFVGIVGGAGGHQSGARGGGGHDDDVAAVIAVEPTMAKNLTLTGLTVPYTRDIKKLGENDAEDGRETAISVSSCSPQPAPEIPDEPIVKSPPEPTRVKSPEQILMRSPDPVNWTVPLDTGKTFTVTQNVKEGENYSRPQSEIKASTPVEKPPPPPQSAPPQLTEQAKMDAWKHAEPKKGTTTSPTGAVGVGRSIVATQPTAGAGGLPSPPPPPPPTGKPVPGSTLRCLDDPIFDVDIAAHLGGGGGVGGVGIGVSAGGGGNTSSSSTSTTTAVTARTTAQDVLEKARDRFDRFWGGSKEEQV